MKCPHCHKRISPSDVARSIAAQGAGRKPELTACEFCRKEFGTVAMRNHIARCPANPDATKSPAQLRAKAKAKAAKEKKKNERLEARARAKAKQAA